MMQATVGQKAPNLKVSKWMQGIPTNIDKEKDRIVLVEVFQVNCPGCFLYGIPEAINIYKKYQEEGVTVLGIATAFEDFDKNTLENLELLLKTGEVIGDTKEGLSQHGKLDDNKLSYKIPFPVAMDSLIKETGNITKERMLNFIYKQTPNFDSQPEDYKNQIFERVKQYLQSKEYTAETFEGYSLNGTPSIILVDRKGVLRDISFGQSENIERKIQLLLNE
jgi:thiol-disulfide isomerase/thioredoxin